MTTTALLGRVVVVAGTAGVLPDIADALVDAGAFVAFAAPGRDAATAHAGFRVDPADPSVWPRIAPHVEQRLGPVDAVVCDGGCYDVIRPVFEPDLRRRGHGAVICIDADDDVSTIVSRLAGTR